jgi:bleomycin hydrolase
MSFHPQSFAEGESVSAKIGGITPDFISSLREGYIMDAADRARHNAVSGGDINSLALNRAILRGNDGHFSHRIRTKGITHQKSSGRCWMFAALNTLRPRIIRDLRVSEFEFSAAYLQFWDKMERANLYMESIIERRGGDFLDREWEAQNNSILHEGGWWNFVAGLIRKYGVVPQSAMPETHGSSNTNVLNEVFARLVRSRSVGILKSHAEGVQEKGLRSMKEDALREVYRFLVINLGEPPVEFDWRYKRETKPGDETADGVLDADLTATERFTPGSFFDKFVGRSLDEYVTLYNDPKNETGGHYSFRGANNIMGNSDMDFVNVGMETMKSIAIDSIKGNDPMWFAVNMSFDQSEKHGVMHDGLYDYESLFGLDLKLGKADRAQFHTMASNHAMTLMGVDLDARGRPLKWLVENSWGEEKGTKGWWTIYDPWFDEHVYTITVHRSHVPEGTLACFGQQPTELPAWYPGAAGAS